MLSEQKPKELYVSTGDLSFKAPLQSIAAWAVNATSLLMNLPPDVTSKLFSITDMLNTRFHFLIMNATIFPTSYGHSLEEQTRGSNFFLPGISPISILVIKIDYLPRTHAQQGVKRLCWVSACMYNM